MAIPVSEGMLLWEPTEQVKEQANIRHYMQWLERERGLHFTHARRVVGVVSGQTRGFLGLAVGLFSDQGVQAIRDGAG